LIVVERHPDQPEVPFGLCLGRYPMSQIYSPQYA